jgi:hypothetical protein
MPPPHFRAEMKIPFARDGLEPAIGVESLLGKIDPDKRAGRRSRTWRGKLNSDDEGSVNLVSTLRF